jgi:hypothetical protein
MDEEHRLFGQHHRSNRHGRNHRVELREGMSAACASSGIRFREPPYACGMVNVGAAKCRNQHGRIEEILHFDDSRFRLSRSDSIRSGRDSSEGLRSLKAQTGRRIIVLPRCPTAGGHRVPAVSGLAPAWASLSFTMPFCISNGLRQWHSSPLGTNHGVPWPWPPHKLKA